MKFLTSNFNLNIGYFGKIGGESMCEKGQVRILVNQHQELEVQLKRENTQPRPDEDQVNTLKRKKLRIKDAFASMEAL